MAKDYQLSYFKSRDTEIDLILSKPREELLVEIKSSAVVDPMKVERFARLTKDFPKAPAYWLSLDPSPQSIAGVHCLHWQEGLRKIFGEVR